MTRKFYLTFLAGIVILCASSGVSRAAVISPGLQSALDSLGLSGHVSVIINLADKVDPGQLPAIGPTHHAANDKAHKRDELVKALKDKANLTQGALKSLLNGRGATRMIPFWVTNSVVATVSPSVISELMSMPEIESIELDAVLHAPSVVPAAAATPEWNITRINAPILWSAGITGAGIVVANLDTGVDVTHQDLGPKWRGGACASPPDCDSWFDPYLNSTQPYDTAGSSTGHGTGTMGVMIGNSATDAYGVAPGAQWIAAKIFDDSGIALTSNIILAFQWVLAPGGNSANAPDVVNNSWGFDSPGQCVPALPSTLQAAIQNVQAAGIAVVFSAGNSGPSPSTSVSPANYPGSFAVGATDMSNNIADFSSRGPSACDNSIFPHVVSPGIGIYTAAPAGAFQSVSGTSFSAPHVTGAMALLADAFPTLTPSQLETALEQTAIHLTGAPPDDTVPNNTYGYGLIDLAAAYKDAFISIKGDVAQIVSIPSSWVFSDTVAGSLSPSSAFTIANQGTANLVIGPSPGGVSLGGTNALDFAITSDGCSGATIPSMGSCIVSVAFSPGSIGPKSAELTILSDDPINATLNVPLSGNGVAPYTVAVVRDSVTVATYHSIQAAYNNCLSGDTIKLRSTTFIENPDFNSPFNIAVGLQGGYDPAFGVQSGFTTLQGILTISKGTVTVGNLILQ